jgi:hypothetical protein
VKSPVLFTEAVPVVFKSVGVFSSFFSSGFGMLLKWNFDLAPVKNEHMELDSTMCFSELNGVLDVAELPMAVMVQARLLLAHCQGCGSHVNSDGMSFISPMRRLGGRHLVTAPRWGVEGTS